MVTEEGGPTSHTAIIARSLGIPAVVAARHVAAIPDGTLLLVDGASGEVIKEPTVDQQATAGTVSRPHREMLIRPGSTADGHRIALLANIGSDRDVATAQECGAEGVGLYRTELCFLGRTEAPSVAEQICAYRAVFSRFGGVGWSCVRWTPAPTSRCRSWGASMSRILPWAYADSVQQHPTPKCFMIN
jgi:phosphoenolpyruvate-protein kinase (PTS system EI component)